MIEIATGDNTEPMTVSIHRIPAFQDNYLWLLHNEASGDTAVVDPGDAAPVIERLQELDLPLSAIIITHHHPDHTGGIDTLLDTWRVPVYGPASGTVPQVDQPLTEGDKVTIAGCDFTILEVPGHTLDHIAYFCEDLDGNPGVFCGDTLFAGGCGRLFEGTPEQMVTSLEKLMQLPDSTRIYCAHEYTQANLRFAAAVEPDNTDLRQRVAEVKRLREQQRATVPSVLATERQTNPFLRYRHTAVMSAASAHAGRQLGDATDAFAVIRGWKDSF